MTRALTMTIVFEGNSLNYGEGIANISELKKLHRSNGEVYSFASRQSLRYDMVRLGNEWYGWNLDTVAKEKGGVVQFRKDVTIVDSVEMDLFGYLKTSQKSEKRPAVVRLSHAISLEPYRGDLEFLNNMGLASRIDQMPNLANIEQHASLYTYTVTADLSRVGVDGEVELPNEQKAERIQQFLEILKFLNRDIRGRQESLAPLFVIGGVYKAANPFFLGKVQLKQTSGKWEIDIAPLESTMEQTFAGEPVGERTRIGMVSSMFGNEEEYQTTFGNRVMSIEAFFQHIQQEVAAFYGV
ncbi:type I-B CRISPR-associated protein Cas7/Cst2/DevR [Aneurinibacillus danicus]|jgi:CRISPR-associated protein Cst2|uniref:Type I-B CRISPR-associated protein Cas7/Cst2/DevR n=1 Tax=Aneurinibacillus danicus TaxID=267746 RepID=A0A511VA86_9BACL|nr:type I-B CRISPR-associated protein Cas7/Cst2/DevR [Aneurinibacillus danicus]GEN35837.1 type I-B CRISPR-associated protein Cas7/Cst2/DevR [Aneurinibacillus danicus]